MSTYAMLRVKLQEDNLRCYIPGQHYVKRFEQAGCGSYTITGGSHTIT